MLGRIVTAENGWRIRLEREEIGGLVFLRAEIPGNGWLGKHRLARGARLLAAHGVTRVVTPPGFGRWDILRGQGLSRVDTGAFCRAMAGTMALTALEQKGRRPEDCAVILRGDRADAAMYRTAEELCPFVRRLAVSAAGGAALAEHLWREYGMPIVEDRRICDLAVHFSDCSAGAECQTIFLGGTELPPRGFKTEVTGITLPENCDCLALTAALWEMGRLAPGTVRVDFP